MNRSFSKIRHIQEANRLLEKRLLNEQYREYPGGPIIYVFDGKKFTFDPNTNKYTPYLTPEEKAGWTDEKKKLYACVYNKSSKSKIGNSGGFSIEGATYFSNGRYYYPSAGTGNYSCNGDEIVRQKIDRVEGQSQQTSGSTAVPAAGKESASSPVKSEKGGGIKYQYCRVVDGLEKSCYNEKHVKRLQGCLGLTGRNVDGYFGNATENILHQKFPEYKGKKIFTPDIDKICGLESPKLDAGTGVLLPQDQSPIPTIGQIPGATTQPVQSTTGTNMVPSLKIDTKTQGAAIQQKILDLKKRNPNISNSEIAAILKREGIEIPKG